MIKPLVAKLFPSCIGLTGDTPTTTGLIHASGAPAGLSADGRPPGFFDIGRPKSALALSVRESIRPLCQVAGLFFLWGLAYGFVDTLNKRFERLIGISTEQYIGLHAAYFGFVPPRGASRA